MLRVLTLSLVLALSLAGCGPDDPETDSGTEDTGTTDTGADTNMPDTNMPDTNMPDTNMPDTNMPDTNTPDTNMPDTNTPDTNTPDTDTPDTDTPDTDTPDTDTPDTDTPDTGSDAGEDTGSDAAEDTGPDATEDAGPGCLPKFPAEHRPAAIECTGERMPGATVEPGSFPGAGCESDTDCTEGEDGRCTFGRGGPFCTYNACRKDDDCEGGSTCECEGGRSSDNNICITGNCQTDADCGATGFCSPSLGGCGDYSGTQGYWCHTCEDECVDDADCEMEPGGFGRPYCAFDPARSIWACASAHCAG